MKFKRGDLVYVKSLPAGRESIRSMHGPAFIETVTPSVGFYGLLFVGDDDFVYQAKEEHLRSIRKNEKRVAEFIHYLKPRTGRRSARDTNKLAYALKRI